MHFRITVMDVFDVIGGKFVYVTTFRFPPGAPQLESLSCLLAFLVTEIDLNIARSFSIAYLDGDYEMRSIESDEEFKKIIELATMTEGPAQIVLIGMSVSDKHKMRKGGIPVDEKLMANLVSFIRSNHMFENEASTPGQSFADKSNMLLVEQRHLLELSGAQCTEQPITMRCKTLAELMTVTGYTPKEKVAAVPKDEPNQSNSQLDDLISGLEAQKLTEFTIKKSEPDILVQRDPSYFEQIIKSDSGQSAITVLCKERADSVSVEKKKYVAKTVRDSLKATENTLLWRINYLLSLHESLKDKVEEVQNTVQQVERDNLNLPDSEHVTEGEQSDPPATPEVKNDNGKPARRNRGRGRGRKSRKGKK